MWAVLIGMGLGLIFFESVPEVMPTTNLLTSIILGGITGWAAVGANQFARLTFGEDGKRRAFIKAEQVIIKEEKPAEESKPAKHSSRWFEMQATKLGERFCAF